MTAEPTAPLDERIRDRLAVIDGGFIEIFESSPMLLIEGLLAAINGTAIADGEDVTDWQRGYRACAIRLREAILAEIGG